MMDRLQCIALGAISKTTWRMKIGSSIPVRCHNVADFGDDGNSSGCDSESTIALGQKGRKGDRHE